MLGYILIVLIALGNVAQAGGYHRKTNPGDHPLTPMVEVHEADPTICTVFPTPEWSAATYKWEIMNNTDRDSRTSGHGVALALRYGTGVRIDVASENGPQVALARRVTADDYTVLLPGQTCYGVYDPAQAAALKGIEGRMVIHTVELAPANAGTVIDQAGLDFYNASLYVVTKAVLSHSVAKTPIGRHIVDYGDLTR